MKKIIFFNNKGGVGKTASVTTVAHMLATVYQKKTLLVDLDPQMNTTMMYTDMNCLEIMKRIYKNTLVKGSLGVEDLLLQWGDVDAHTCVRHTKYENLDIIPSFLTLSEAEERLKADIWAPQQMKLKTRLAQLESEYDYCIMDSSPSISMVNVNGLCAADEVYIPVHCDGGSLLGASITMNLIRTVQGYNRGLEVAGMFFTRFNPRKIVSKEAYNYTQETYGELLLPITIGISKNIEEGSLVQYPLLEYDHTTGAKKNKVTEQYLELTDYIIHRNSPAEKAG